jgi:drug/metabolite transporter (DMT)-like permease
MATIRARDGESGARPAAVALADGQRATRTGGGAGGRGAAWGGVSIAVVSAATFGTSGTFGTALLDAGWTPATAVLARIGLAALIVTVPAVLALRGRWGLLRRSAWLVVAYGLVGVAGCQVFYFYAISQMPVGVALLIEYTGSILVVAWLWLRHGQRPRWLTIGGAVAAVGGLALMVVIGGSAEASSPASAGISPAGLLWAALAAVSMAVYFILSAGTAKPAGAGPPPAAPDEQSLPPIALAWAGLLVGAVALGALQAVHALPFGASARDVTLLRHPVPPIVPIVGIALVSTALGYSAGIVAARRLGAKLASFIGMAEIVFAVSYAWILLGQLPAATQFAGGALILAGVSLVKIDET